MSKKQEKELVAAQETALSAAQDTAAWGGSEVSSRDIVIPKLLIMQNTSELVGDGKAKLGDIIDSLTGEIMGSIDKPVKFIPFHMEKVWIISSKKAGDTRFNFEKYEPVENQNYPFTDKIGDVEMKYEYTLQFYCLLPHDTSIPYVISFKSTSSRAGKVVATQMYVRNKAAGLVPPAYIMELGGHKEKNEGNTFAVMDVKAVEKTPDNLISDCLTWYKAIAAGKTKVAPEASSGSSNAPENYADSNVQF